MRSPIFLLLTILASVAMAASDTDNLHIDTMALLNVLKKMDSKLRCEVTCNVECENSIRGTTSGTDDYVCPPNQQTNRELMDSDKMDLFKKGDSKLRCESKCEVECENSIRGKTSGTDDYMCPPNQQTNRELMDSDKMALLNVLKEMDLFKKGDSKLRCESKCEVECENSIREKLLEQMTTCALQTNKPIGN
ncbi:uncharacterized protein [Amphiura filiformis]|uniref:uncharacterized protein n=1 Tax=Amphiura filiformis TaxID=82378 RepID=UPI003B21EEA6